MKLPPPPHPEPPPDRDMVKLAPLFAEKVFRVLHEMNEKGHDAIVFEAFRSDERAAWLYESGRTFDDGRGVVTGAKTARKSWHRYGLAVDIISKSRQWDAPPTFWRALRLIAAECGLVSGNDWDRDGIPVEDDPDEHLSDPPHVQWYVTGMHVTPSDHAWELLQSRGVEAVWKEVRALDYPRAA